MSLVALLDEVIEAHGGLQQWQSVEIIETSFWYGSISTIFEHRPPGEEVQQRSGI